MDGAVYDNLGMKEWERRGGGRESAGGVGGGEGRVWEE